ncbi:BnaA04g18670D [Brassica napus]|uniref:(rape) hypothetical protein n=1 Tax=Brassica napus TaxID=3708 RepID=A0A078G2A5_BRANA|nr:unnamed protein product [Brassica napus]CDY19127.1 BnaA04g18670D [Brassica napus]
MIICGRGPHIRGRCINGVFFIKVDMFFTEGTMINYNGKLGLLWSEGWLSRSSTCVNLCVLEDIGKQEWSEHVYVLSALWEDIVGSASLSFVGMTQTNEIVMRSLAYPPSPLYLFYFNSERNTVVRVAIQGMDVSEYDRVHIFLDHLENVKLIASAMKTRRRNLSGNDLTTTRRNTRSKTLENGRDNSLPFPVDLFMEIFSRLPVKSIAICRCVSKTWSSVLRRQDFTELFLSRSRTLPKLLLAYQKDGDLFFFSAPQPQNPEENSSPVVATYRMKLSFDAYFRNGAFGINGLDHGLVGLSGRTHSVICNPSTGQSLPFTRAKTRSMSLFGYDPIDKQFSGLLNVVAEEYQVLTLGTENPSWRTIDCGCILSYYSQHVRQKCINGVLHYLSTDMSTETTVLVCFDVRSEKFSFVKVKTFVTEGTMINYDGKLVHIFLDHVDNVELIVNSVILTMVNYNGKLGFLLSGESGYVYERSTSVNLWVLEDTDKQEWSERTFVLPALWEDIVGSVRLGFVGMTRTNEIVMRPLGLPGRPFHLIYFNIERNTVVRVSIQGMDVSEYDHVHIFLDHVENVKLL